MSITHAFVNFKSGLDSIVPLNAVQNFFPKSATDFRKGKKYKVWSSSKDGGKKLLLNANIVLLGTSCRDVKKKINENNLNLKPNQKVKRTYLKKGSKQPINGKVQRQATQKQNLNILKKYSALMQNREILEETVEETHAGNLEDSADTVLLTPDADSVAGDFDDRLAEVQAELNGIRHNHRDEDQSSMDVENPNDGTSIDHRKADLQRPGEDRLEEIQPELNGARHNHRDEGQSSMGAENPNDGTSTNHRSVDLQRPGPSINPSLIDSDQNKNYVGRRVENDKDWVYVMDDKKVHVDLWESISAKNDSRFIRELAQILWGTDVLKQRCLDPQRANKYKKPNEEPRLPLTPKKLEVLKNCVYNKITNAGITGKQRAARMKKISKHLRDKLYDVRRNSEKDN